MSTWFIYSNFMVNMDKITSVEDNSESVVISLESGIKLHPELSDDGVKELFKAFKKYKGIKGD